MKPALVFKIALVVALSATVAALLTSPTAEGVSGAQAPAYLQIPARINMVRAKEAGNVQAKRADRQRKRSH